MHETYDDIKDRIDEEPTWYDANGVPRYGEFKPERCPNIYSNQVVLFRIRCQGCSKTFDVEAHSSWFASIKRPRRLHYGDPPAHGCVGDTMNCEDEEVLQVWHRPDAAGLWVRRPELEGPINFENGEEA
jgi:hypothetical protein